MELVLYYGTNDPGMKKHEMMMKSVLVRMGVKNPQCKTGTGHGNHRACRPHAGAFRSRRTRALLFL